jgi:PIN domain nuclease of toxin-antitoxin system
MKLLLDTHILLWFLEGESKIPPSYLDAVRDPKNEIFVSVLSFFEIAIKIKIGKLK